MIPRTAAGAPGSRKPQDLTAAPQIDYFYTFPRRSLQPLPPFMTKSAKSDMQPSFEEALAELEKIVARMESGKLTLEQSLDAHRRGIELAQLCQSVLARAQQQVKVLEENALKNFPSGDESSEQ